LQNLINFEGAAKYRLAAEVANGDECSGFGDCVLRYAAHLRRGDDDDP